jgi:formate dehydrogenase alpha subunit
MLNVTIDGRKVQAQSGQTVLQAATAAGIKIPVLCHHPALPPEGACRVCLVEIEGQRTLQPACTFPLDRNDLVVHTHSPKVEEARKFVLELLLSDHPLDCMTCEMAGHCTLQDLAYEYGIKESRFPGEKHDYPLDDPNPFFIRDYNKCIVCRRCVRACNHINGVEAIGMVWRGFRAKVGTAFDGVLEDSPCEFCGMCVEVCPTGALIPRQKVGKGREWDTKKVATICTYCGVGCQIELHVKDNQIVQTTSSWEGPANHGWTCVKGRFGNDFVSHPDRLTKPLVRREVLDAWSKKEPVTRTSARGPLGKEDFAEVDWDTALSLVASRFMEVKHAHGGDAWTALCSAKCTNEENYLMQKMARQIMGTHNIDHCARL